MSIRKFIDSNVVIAGFVNNANKQKILDFLAKEELVINMLVLVESYYQIKKISKNKDIAVAMLKFIKKSDNILLFPIDLDVFFEVCKMISKNNLDFSDLIHYVTAMKSNCSSIVSYDRHFNNLMIPREEP